MLRESLGKRLTWLFSGMRTIRMRWISSRKCAANVPLGEQGVQAIAIHVGTPPEDYAELCHDSGQGVLCLIDADRGVFGNSPAGCFRAPTSWMPQARSCGSISSTLVRRATICETHCISTCRNSPAVRSDRCPSARWAGNAASPAAVPRHSSELEWDGVPIRPCSGTDWQSVLRRFGNLILDSPRPRRGYRRWRISGLRASTGWHRRRCSRATRDRRIPSVEWLPRCRRHR